MPTNVTPIRRPPVQASPRPAGVAVPNVPAQQDWWGMPHPEHPIFPGMGPIWAPPGVCGPCEPFPPCPPLCPPSPISGVAKANACWDETQQLKAFLTTVITDILESPAGQQLLTDLITTIIQTTPGVVPPGGGLGVVDGSKAAAGHIGQVVTMSTTIAYAAYPAITQPIVTVGVMPPGDWDMFCSLSFPTGAAGAIGGASMALNGTPGVSSGMSGLVIFGVTTGMALEGATIIGEKGSASWSVPTVISFQTVINQSTDSTLPAGTATLLFEGRRAR